MGEHFDMIKDIYLSPNSLAVHAPFSQLKKINDQLLRERGYHSQVVLEFYLLLDAVDLMKEKWVSRSFLEDFLYHALISQRIAEYALVCHQFSVGLVGIKMDSKENLYMLGLCLYALWAHLNILNDAKNFPALLVNRSQTKTEMARMCQQSIEKIFILLGTQKVKDCSDKKMLCGKLALCNQNLNGMLVVMRAVN